jgi:hypothetical protein
MILPGMYVHPPALSIHNSSINAHLNLLYSSYANTLLVLLNNRARPHSQTENANTYYVSDETALGSTRVDVDLGAFIAAQNQPEQLEPFAAAPREHGAVSWDSNSLELGDDVRFFFFLSLRDFR